MNRDEVITAMREFCQERGIVSGWTQDNHRALLRRCLLRPLGVEASKLTPARAVVKDKDGKIVTPVVLEGKQELAFTLSDYTAFDETLRVLINPSATRQMAERAKPPILVELTKAERLAQGVVDC